MTDFKITIHETCACGAVLDLAGEFNYLSFTHQQWTARHKDCRPVEVKAPSDTARVIVERNVTVEGWDAAFWNESYKLLRESIVTALDDFCHDDDVAEEAILSKAIEDAGEAIKLCAEFKEFIATGGPKEHGRFANWMHERASSPSAGGQK